MSDQQQPNAKPNRPTLSTLSIDELAELPGAMLYDMQCELDLEKMVLAKKIAKLYMANVRKFGETAAKVFADNDRESGVVRLDAGAAHQAVVEFKKTVSWDQAALRKLWNQINEAGEDPGVYMKWELKVSETAYKGWPDDVRAAFELARTVKPGKTDFWIEPAKGVGG